MHSYPIWNEVTACNYQSSKSWGSKDTMCLNQYVGSSASNSQPFAHIVTTKRAVTLPDGNPGISFLLRVDDQPIKTALFTAKNGRAVDLVSVTTHI